MGLKVAVLPYLACVESFLLTIFENTVFHNGDSIVLFHKASVKSLKDRNPSNPDLHSFGIRPLSLILAPLLSVELSKTIHEKIPYNVIIIFLEISESSNRRIEEIMNKRKEPI